MINSWLYRPPNKQRPGEKNKKNEQLLDVQRKKPPKKVLLQEQRIAEELNSPAMKSKALNLKKKRSQRKKRTTMKTTRARVKSQFTMVDQQNDTRGLKHFPTFKSSFLLSSWVYRADS